MLRRPHTDVSSPRPHVRWRDDVPTLFSPDTDNDSWDHSALLASFADLKAKYIKDFHRPCSLSHGEVTVPDVDTAFDTCAEYTNYVRASFLAKHFASLPLLHLELGDVGGSLGGTQRRDRGVSLDMSATDHTGLVHTWTLDFVVIDDLPYAVFIGSTAIKGPLRTFFFESLNWTNDALYLQHQFTDCDDADEDNEPPPGLFPVDYFNVLAVPDLRPILLAAVSSEYQAADPTIVDYLASFHSTWINNFAGLRNIPTLAIQWAADTPVSLRSHTQRYAPALTVTAEQEFKHLLDIGFIRYSKSTFLSPLTIAPKKTTPFVRLCGNYKKANAFMVNRNLHIPLVRQELNKCLAFSIFAELDWKNAYHQIPLHVEDSPRLALQTIWGNVEPLFLWEGVKSASDLMENAKNTIFAHDDFADWTVALFDNILILATSFTDLTTKLQRIMARAVHFNLVLNIEKSRIGVRTIDFFGYTLSAGKISICESRKAPIMAMPPPSSLTKMRTFLGLTNAFSAFTPGYSCTLLPLYATCSDAFAWPPPDTPTELSPVWSGPEGSVRLTAFEAIKLLIADSLVMHFPDYALDWTVRTDASEFAISGTIVQHRPATAPAQPPPSLAIVDAKISSIILPPTEEVVYVYNMVLSATAARWDIHKKEAFAIVATIKAHAALLWGKPFIVETDHRNLEYLQDNTSAIVRRWMHVLSGYDYIVKHIPGSTNVLADALSRLYAFINVFAVVDLADLFKYHHCDEKGHYGVDETVRRLQAAGVPCTYTQVHDLCAACEWCQMTANRPRHAPHAERKIIATTAARQQVGMDGLGPFHVGDKIYYVITAVDQFDKFPTLFLTTDKTAESYVKAVINYISRNDMFETLSTDQGSDFTSTIATATAEFFRFRHIFAPVGRPQGSGAEGTNKQVNRLLSAILTKYRDSGLGLLPEYIALVEFILRTHVSTETGMSPFAARFGRTPDFPVLWGDEAITPTNADTHLAAVQQMFRDIETAINAHKARVQLGRTGGEPSLLAPGDLVKLLPLDKPPHGSTRYSGPYEVTATDAHNNVTCTHVISGVTGVYHPERLLPFLGDRAAAVRAGLLSTGEHIIERFITHRGDPNHRRAMDFKVSWAGFEAADDSWLPYASVHSHPLFDNYCLFAQLYALRTTARLSQLQRAALNRIPINNVKAGDTIYIPLRTWAVDNSWYDELRLPNQDTSSFVVLGTILRLSPNKKTIDITFPVFDETYTKITHGAFAAYGHTTALLPSDTLIDAAFVLLHPQLIS